MNPPTLLAQRYQIEGVLGEGGMGRVYRARQLRLNRTVAIKALINENNTPQEARARQALFEGEAQILATLDHPSLVNVLDFFEENGVDYLVMEFVEGKTLTKVVEMAPKPISERRVLQWARELLDVLDYLHSQKPPVILKDLKPDNVMLTPEGRLKVIDFGIAKRLSPTGGTMDIAKGVGTEEYAPLEQYGSGSTDQRSDLYSLGATLYFLLTKEAPPPAWKRATHGEPLPDPRKLNPTVSQSTVDALRKMTGLFPHDRPNNAMDAKAMLSGQPTGGYQFDGSQVAQARTTVKPGKSRTLTASLKGATLLSSSGQRAPALAWFPRQMLLAAGVPGGVTIFDISKRQPVLKLAQRTSPTALAVSPDQKLVAVGGDGGDLNLYESSRGKWLSQLSARAWLRPDPVRGVKFMQSIRTLLALSEAQQLQSYGVESGQKLLSYRPGSTWLSLLGVRLKSFDVSSTQLVAAGASDGSVFSWEASNARLRWTGAHQADVQAVAFSPDGIFLATGALDHKVILWAADSGNQLNQFPHPEPIRALSWSKDGKVLASGSESGTVRLWDLANAKEIARFQGPARVSQLLFSPHSDALAACWHDGSLKLFDLSW